jgi:hypothetical protein
MDIVVFLNKFQLLLCFDGKCLPEETWWPGGGDVEKGWSL